MAAFAKWPSDSIPSSATPISLLRGLLQDAAVDLAVEEGRKAIALGPNDSEAHMHFGQTLSYSGFFEDAVQMCEKGMRLHPHRPLHYFVMTIEVYYRAGRYEECLAMAEQVIDPSREAEYWGGVVGGYVWSAMAHIKLGNESEARKK